MAARKNKKAPPLAPTTTNPERMGEAMANPRPAGNPSPNLQYAPRGGAKDSTPPQEKGAPGRAPIASPDNVVPRTVERLGPKWAPQMPLHSPNLAVGAAETQRNVRILHSQATHKDFWYKRQYGQGM